MGSWKCSLSFENNSIFDKFNTKDEQNLINISRKYIIYTIMSCSANDMTFKSSDDIVSFLRTPKIQTDFVWNYLMKCDVLRSAECGYSAKEWMLENNLIENKVEPDKKEEYDKQLVEDIYCHTLNNTTYVPRNSNLEVREYVRYNVRLSRGEINSLNIRFSNEQVTKMLDKLSEWKTRKGIKFMNDYSAIENWVINWLNTVEGKTPLAQTPQNIQSQTSDIPDWLRGD